MTLVIVWQKIYLIYVVLKFQQHLRSAVPRNNKLLAKKKDVVEKEEDGSSAQLKKMIRFILKDGDVENYTNNKVGNQINILCL